MEQHEKERRLLIELDEKDGEIRRFNDSMGYLTRQLDEATLAALDAKILQESMLKLEDELTARDEYIA